MEQNTQIEYKQIISRKQALIDRTYEEQKFEDSI
jgi:hypothetical protein